MSKDKEEVLSELFAIAVVSSLLSIIVRFVPGVYDFLIRLLETINEGHFLSIVIGWLVGSALFVISGYIIWKFANRIKNWYSSI